MKTNFLSYVLALLVALVGFTSCDENEAPPSENEEEIINRVVLTFTPIGAGDEVREFQAYDPDGDGALPIELDNIELNSYITYSLELRLENTIVGENITSEISKEAEEHMFFYGWSSGLFSNPTGIGNISVRSNTVNYLDQDKNGFPLGLKTSWTTGAAQQNKTFKILLKHQPNMKSASSTVNEGSTDVEIEFNITIK